MAKISFNVDAYTARLIGRENVSKLDGAIIELIKNTYDADAADCFLYYDDMNDILYLGDNGCGMTEEIIQNHWMTIGESSKRNNYYSRSGRVQTGEKGIGRFALDRIADHCEMLTGTIGSDKKLLWSVDWSSFSNGKNITEVDANIENSNLTFDEFLSACSNHHIIFFVRKNWERHGTIFKMSGLRETWDSDLIKKIKSNLASLIPHELSAVYKIYCLTEQENMDDAEVFSNIEAFSYDYKIEFQTIQGKMWTKLWRNEYEFGKEENSILKDIGYLKEKEYFHNKPMEREYFFNQLLPLGDETEICKIGDFGGVLYFSKVTQAKKDKERFYQKDISGREDVRDTFGGIKIYRDNFRVRPYGEPKSSAFDWLQLARRKTQSPAGIANPKEDWHASADQMTGSIFISRMNVSLPDQSNREGIVETKEFQHLQECIKNIIALIERDRQAIYRKLDEKYKKNHPTEGIQDKINQRVEGKRKQEKHKKSNEAISTSKNTVYEDINYGIDPCEAKLVLDEKDEQIEELETEIKMLRALATTGIVTNTYIHEFKTSSHRLNMKIVMAKEAIDFDGDIEGARKYIDEANDICKTFNSWFQVTIDAVRKDKRRRKKVNIVNMIDRLINSWNMTLHSKKIKIELDSSEKIEIMIKCFPYEIETIINNLITNSTASFKRNRTEGCKIQIKLDEMDGFVILEYADTGVGLASIYKQNPRKILEAYETDKRDSDGNIIGTGMGLWIVDHTVSDYGGTIDLEKNRTEDRGFYMTITLKQ